MTEPKILYLDIETAPLEVYAWGLWDVQVAVNQIKTESCLLSAAWMFEGDSRVSYQDNSDADDGPRDDTALVVILREILDMADIVVTQNGKKFDIRRINARLAALNLSPPSPFRQVDTKEVAKQVFAFTSNRLEWLAEHVAKSEKLKHKNFPGFELWLEVLKDNPKAWAEMRRYNIQDVKALRALYLRLRPWMKNHPNMGQYAPDSLRVCPKCGSKNVTNRGYAYTVGGKYQRVQCNGCGGWSREGKNLIEAPKRKVLLRGE